MNSRRTKVLSRVVDVFELHSDTWKHAPDEFWLAGLMEEVSEVASTLVGKHEGPLVWELQQVAAICLNWLDRIAESQGDIE